ncbi:DUF3300 domain-containing protein [Shewanella waksmanii]|uniref:DUF3300 domain-containing protein n=1 Tax=Shewanella waksmanii TaxID=213783 RepID=UPI003735B462
MKTLIRQWQLGLCLLLSSVGFAFASENYDDDKAQFSDAEMAQMLAPIALYPDSLLTHILIAATYPLEVVEADRFVKKHTKLPVEQLIEKSESEQWDPSVTALLAFPTVLERLSEDLNWTQDLGDAFLQDEAAVMASIQTLRKQADEAGNLQEMDNMTVTKVNNQVIIEPSEPQVIYVPYYDPRVVYGYWRWHAYPPIYWHYPSHYVHYRHGYFYWHSRTYISFNFYFSAFHWHKHHVVITHHRKSHRYRHHGRIVTSKGAQRWHHKPQHRRGVAYRSPVVKQRYNSPKPSRYYKNNQHVKHTSLQQSPKHNHVSTSKQREQAFSQKMQQHKVAKPQHLANNKHQTKIAPSNKAVKQPALSHNTRQYGTNKATRDKSTQNKATREVSKYSSKTQRASQPKASSSSRQYIGQSPSYSKNRTTSSQMKSARPTNSRQVTRSPSHSSSRQKVGKQ